VLNVFFAEARGAALGRAARDGARWRKSDILAAALKLS
jgi:hypothetical protein